MPSISFNEKLKTQAGAEIWVRHEPCDFGEAYELQLELHDKRIRDEIPDTLLLLQHIPTITRGRGLQLAPGEDRRREPKPLGPLPVGAKYFEIERGGDLTAHEPGQWVGYPIAKLGAGPFFGARDVGLAVRTIESKLIEALRLMDLEGQVRSGATGVWVGSQKIASLGIAVKRWVMLHGFAINAVNDLGLFAAIEPCGFEASVMTSVGREMRDREPKVDLGLATLQSLVAAWSRGN